MIEKEKDQGKIKRVPYKTTIKRAKIAGILCLFIVAALLFFMSPVFKIKTINVVGNIKITSEEIITLSGVSTGDNIFSIKDEVAQKNIKKLGKIASLKIVRSLPSTVTLEVDEKTECAYIKEKGTYTAIDEKGMVIVTSSALEAPVPLIEGIKLLESETGQYMKIDADNAKELSSLISRMLTELKSGDILSNIKSIDLTDLSNIRMTLTTDTLVNMGIDGKEDGDSIEYKIAFLRAIIPELPETQNGGVIELADTENVTSRMS